MIFNHVYSLNGDLSDLESLENHVHGQIKNNGIIGTTSGLFVVTENNGVVTIINTKGNLKNNCYRYNLCQVITTTTNDALTTTNPVIITASFAYIQ
jgi:hypothetical protein